MSDRPFIFPPTFRPMTPEERASYRRVMDKVFVPLPVPEKVRALEAQLAEAKAVLREVEYCVPDCALEDPEPECPLCWHIKEDGHAPDCRLAKVLEEKP